MNRKELTLAAIVVSLVACLAIVTFAATPIVQTVSCGTASGYGAWTNTKDYVGMKVVAIEMYNPLIATTVTVKRARGAYTNTVLTYITTTSADHYNETNHVYWFKNDIIYITTSANTGIVVDLVGELEP